jgi:RNA polymerase sigma-70 factor (ECF subfamily)
MAKYKVTLTDDVVQRYLDALATDTPADPVIRDLLDRAVGRLRLLAATGLLRGPA